MEGPQSHYRFSKESTRSILIYLGFIVALCITLGALADAWRVRGQIEVYQKQVAQKDSAWVTLEERRIREVQAKDREISRLIEERDTALAWADQNARMRVPLRERVVEVQRNNPADSAAIQELVNSYEAEIEQRKQAQAATDSALVATRSLLQITEDAYAALQVAYEAQGEYVKTLELAVNVSPGFVDKYIDPAARVVSALVVIVVAVK